jgi:hypothetical protein
MKSDGVGPGNDLKPFLKIMTATRCISCFFSGFLQRIVQEFLALFRFTEMDARAMLSAYGLVPFQIDGLQGDPPKRAESGSKGEAGRQQMAQPTGPIPVCIHPERFRLYYRWSASSAVQSARAKAASQFSGARTRLSNRAWFCSLNLTAAVRRN